VDGHANDKDRLTFAELTAGGALAYRTGTTPGTGWGGGTGPGAVGLLRRVMRASPGLFA
jgi:hypothetical protein